MKTFGLTIIALILLLGGLIAFMGNLLGRWVDKKRLSLLQLRPRYTATTFTILAGIVIALVTLAIAALISDNFRTALFGLDELKTNLVQTKAELQKTQEELLPKLKEKALLETKLDELNTGLRKAKDEINLLYLAKEKLEEEVFRSREGTVLFQKGQPLLRTVLKNPSKTENPAAFLRQLLSAADQKVRSYGVKSSQHLIFCSPEDFDLAVERIKAEKRETVIQLVTTRNTVWGETVPCTFNLLPNSLVFKKGEEIVYTEIDGTRSLPETEQQILLLLEKAHLTAKLHGVLPDLSKGNIGSIPYGEIEKLAKKIYNCRQKAEVAVSAKEDTHISGPLEINFSVFFK